MLEQIGMGGGCHWCTEAVFNSLIGTEDVKQGFISSEPPNDAYSEAVLVQFDPEIIPLSALIEVHLRTHASTSNHKMRIKYRSAIYVVDYKQITPVQNMLEELQNQFDKPLVTEVLQFKTFKASLPKFQNYHQKNSEGQFCQTYIDPKLSMLRKKYGSIVR